LFKQPAPQLASRNAEKKSVKELPGGAAQLVAEAQSYFSARQFDKAGDDYQKNFAAAMKTTDWCWPTWQRLKMEQGRLADAEKTHLGRRRSKSDDAYNLSILWLT